MIVYGDCDAGDEVYGGCSASYCYCAAEEERAGAERDAQKQAERETAGVPTPAPTVEAAPTTKVVNKHRHTPTPADVYIGRGSQWGNNFSHYEGTKARWIVASREAAIEAHRTELWALLKHGDITLESLAALHGKTLVCFCAPQACHGHTLAKAAAWAVRELERIAALDELAVASMNDAQLLATYRRVICDLNADAYAVAAPAEDWLRRFGKQVAHLDPYASTQKEV